MKPDGGAHVAGPSDARARHAERLAVRLERLRELDRRIAWARLAWALATLPLAALVWALIDRAAGLALAGLLVAGFVVLVRYHRRLERSIARHRARLGYARAQIARRDVDWEGLPAPLETTPDPAHPFAADLDLAGERSLHRLVDVAVSLAGSLRLLEWLSEAETPLAEIDRRQAIARELQGLPILRGRIALEATMARDGERRVVARRDRRWDADRLAVWLGAPFDDARHAGEPRAGRSTESRGGSGRALERWTRLAAVLAGLNIAYFAGAQLGLAPPGMWRVTFVPYVLVLLAGRRAVGDPFAEALALHGALEPLIALFRRIERLGCRHSPRLAELCRPIREGDFRPSRTLPRISRLVAAASVRGNALLWLAIHAVIPWDLLVARALRRRQAEIAAHAPAWMEAFYDLEALCGLANLADVREGMAWPLIDLGPKGDVETSGDVGLSGDGALVDSDGAFVDGDGAFVDGDGALVDTVGLGHPLLSDRALVRNDFRLEREGEIVLITGSNMSGKSTFLRALGVNAALAHAGGPVVARAWTSRPLRLFSSLSVDDSVTDGISTFYAEVRRLRALLDSIGRGEEAASDRAGAEAAVGVGATAKAGAGVVVGDRARAGVGAASPEAGRDPERLHIPDGAERLDPVDPERLVPPTDPDRIDTPAARPVLFLIDELYRGTNNRERLAGSRALIRALVGRKAVGVVSTHDLDLVRLADELPGLRNAHFRDDVSNGRMTFDYTLRDGPCPTTNALRVMALGGLPVEVAGAEPEGQGATGSGEPGQSGAPRSIASPPPSPES